MNTRLIAVFAVFKCIIAQNQWSKILVTNGAPWGYSTKVEIIDLHDESNICQNLLDFPLQLFGATAGLSRVLDRYAALVCGGIQPSGLQVDPRCYTVYEDATTVIGMSEHRAYPSAIMINATNIWVTGGLFYENGYELTSTTDIIDAEYKTHVRGPELPIKLQRHCALSIDENTVMITGGFVTTGLPNWVASSSTFFYHFDTNQWSKGPDLNVARGEFGCSLLSKSNGESYVVVTGGANGGDWSSLKSTEIFDFQLNQWMIGPNLPTGISAHAMVSMTNKVYVIGGGQKQGEFTINLDRIYELDEDIFAWKEMKQRLKYARRWIVALAVPDSMTKCSNE